MTELMTVDQQGRTALHYCATNHRTQVVDELLEHWLQAGEEARSLLERRDNDGLTALTHAVIAGNHTIVEHLLMMGADVSCHDNEQHTVVHFATGYNSHFIAVSSYIRLFYNPRFTWKLTARFAELSSLLSVDVWFTKLQKTRKLTTKFAKITQISTKNYSMCLQVFLMSLRAVIMICIASPS